MIERELYDTAELLVKLLKERGLSVSAAESCTGGLFTACITEVPGASWVLNESIVTYSNEAKMRELGVSESTLEEHGAVSYETAKEMAEGIRRHTGADMGIGITGIAGPDGGTDEKPVGTVYAGVALGDDVKVIHMLHSGTRSDVRIKTCLRVLSEAVGALDKE